MKKAALLASVALLFASPALADPYINSKEIKAEAKKELRIELAQAQNPNSVPPWWRQVPAALGPCSAYPTGSQDGCLTATSFGGSIQHSNFFGVIGVSPGYANPARTYNTRPTWNVAGVEWPDGANYTSPAVGIDPTVTPPTGCNFTAGGGPVGNDILKCASTVPNIMGYYFGPTATHNCVSVQMTATSTGTPTFQNDIWDNGTDITKSCASDTKQGYFLQAATGTGVTAVTLSHNTYLGEGDVLQNMFEMDDVILNMNGGTVTEQFDAVVNAAGRHINGANATISSFADYFDGINLAGTNVTTGTLTALTSGSQSFQLPHNSRGVFASANGAIVIQNSGSGKIDLNFGTSSSVTATTGYASCSTTSAVPPCSITSGQLFAMTAGANTWFAVIAETSNANFVINGGTGEHGEIYFIDNNPHGNGSISSTTLTLTSVNGAPTFTLNNGDPIFGCVGTNCIAAGTTVSGIPGGTCTGSGCANIPITVSISQNWPSSGVSGVYAQSTQSEQHSYDVCRNVVAGTSCWFILPVSYGTTTTLMQLDHQVAIANNGSSAFPGNAVTFVDGYPSGTFGNAGIVLTSDFFDAVNSYHPISGPTDPAKCAVASTLSLTDLVTGNPLTTWSAGAGGSTGC